MHESVAKCRADTPLTIGYHRGSVGVHDFSYFIAYRGCITKILFSEKTPYIKKGRVICYTPTLRLQNPRDKGVLPLHSAALIYTSRGKS